MIEKNQNNDGLSDVSKIKANLLEVIQLKRRAFRRKVRKPSFFYASEESYKGTESPGRKWYTINRFILIVSGGVILIVVSWHLLETSMSRFVYLQFCILFEARHYIQYLLIFKSKALLSSFVRRAISEITFDRLLYVGLAAFYPVYVTAVSSSNQKQLFDPKTFFLKRFTHGLQPVTKMLLSSSEKLLNSVQKADKKDKNGVDNNLPQSGWVMYTFD